MRAMWTERMTEEVKKKYLEWQQKHNLWFLLIYLVYGKCFVLVNLSNLPLIHSSSLTLASNHNTRENNGLNAASQVQRMK